MKILITGSNGIIGQRLLERLCSTENNYELILLNRSSAIIPNDINTFIKFESHQLDLLELDIYKIQDLIYKISPEILIHLAWNTNHKDYLNTNENLKWEFLTSSLIDNFYSNGGKKFIGIGTSLEYDWSTSDHEKLNEFSTKLTGSNFLYGKTKLNIFRHLESKKNIKYLWCRVFFVFGPNLSSTRLFPRIVRSFYENGNPICLNLKIKRDYISTFEIANQLVMLLNSDYSGPVNLCSGQSISLNFFTKFISIILNKPINISKTPYSDNFEKKNICGELGVIKKEFKNYKYSKKDIQRDILKSINYINNKN